MYRFTLSLILFAFFFQNGCTALKKITPHNGDTSDVQGLNSQSPLPPLAIKIREKALELRLKEDNPRQLKTLAGAEGGKLPQYVKDLILNEVKNQSWTPLPPLDRPCSVDPKLKHPKDIFYALQRAAFGTTKVSSSNTPDPDQGVKLSPLWSGIKWSQFVGYELETYKLLDQLEAWFSELNPDSYNSMITQSLGLATVPVPENLNDYVRRILVRNDLDRVVNGRGRDREELRCFLANQVINIFEDSTNFGEFIRNMTTFNHFENITDIDFGVITQEEDLAMVNNILTAKKGVKGIYFDIEWKDNGPHNGVAVDPRLIEIMLTKENRERLTRFYARYGVWQYLSPAEMFSMFPNITQLLFRIDTASTWRSGDAKKIAAFLEYTKNTKIYELALQRFNFSDEILKLIDRPLTHIKKVDIFTESWSPMDLSEVARVFPEAQTVTVNNGHVSLSREKLDALQGQKVKVGWQKVFLDSCKPASGTTGNLVFNHPVFAYPNLKVFKNDCSERLSIEQAPTLDDIKNQLIHRLIRENRDQSKEAPCRPVNFKKSK